MTLDILVPQFREDDSVARYLFESIAMQQGINFKDIRVIVCNDGSDVHLSDEFVTGWPYMVDYFRCEHQGVSATRNACLDRSTADLVMFCDIDDGFYSNLGLWTIFKVFEKRPETDVYISTFIEELERPEGITYVDHAPSDGTFVHGKVFRRAYLIENNIRFNPKLTIHEDSYFNRLAQFCTDNVFRSDATFYLWRFRKESVCRRDSRDLYLLRTYGNLMDTETELTEELLRRGKEMEAAELACSVLYMSYYMLCEGRWLTKEAESYAKSASHRIRLYYDRYKALIATIPIEKRMAISQNERGKAIKEGMLMERSGMKTWLNSLR